MKRILLLLFVFLIACGQEEAVSVEDPTELPDLVSVETAVNFLDHPDVVFIDIREQHEYDAGHIPNITLLPMSEIQDRISEIPTDKEVIIACEVGGRSRQVTAWLNQQGFTNIHDLEGGFSAWNKAGYAVEQ